MTFCTYFTFNQNDKFIVRTELQFLLKKPPPRFPSLKMMACQRVFLGTRYSLHVLSVINISSTGIGRSGFQRKEVRNLALSTSHMYLQNAALQPISFFQVIIEKRQNQENASAHPVGHENDLFILNISISIAISPKNSMKRNTFDYFTLYERIGLNARLYWIAGADRSAANAFEALSLLDYTYV